MGEITVDGSDRYAVVSVSGLLKPAWLEQQEDLELWRLLAKIPVLHIITAISNRQLMMWGVNI